MKLRDKTTGKFVRYIQDVSCVFCQKIFHPRFLSIKYCSRKCMGMAMRKPEAICLSCQKSFIAKRTVSKFGVRKTVFCSRQCYGKSLIKNDAKNLKVKFSRHGSKLCFVCNRMFTVQLFRLKKAKTCSHSCSVRSRNQIDHYNWQGGKTPVNKRLRGQFEYKQWRIAVFKRDKYSCTSCGASGVYIEADHIKPFAYFPELRYEISNGRTLCQPCHKLTDSWGVKAKQNYVKL